MLSELTPGSCWSVRRPLFADSKEPPFAYSSKLWQARLRHTKREETKAFEHSKSSPAQTTQPLVLLQVAVDVHGWLSPLTVEDFVVNSPM